MQRRPPLSPGFLATLPDVDPRMLLRATKPPNHEKHLYHVAVRAELGARWHVHVKHTRHQALMLYVAERKRLNDFAQEPANFLVRIQCDGVEYFNDIAKGLPGSRRNEGLSVRELTGSLRPFTYERHMP